MRKKDKNEKKRIKTQAAEGQHEAGPVVQRQAGEWHDEEKPVGSIRICLP